MGWLLAAAVLLPTLSAIGADDALLYRIIRYHMGWEEPDGRPGPGAGGKALRPALCLLACEAVGMRSQRLWRRGMSSAKAALRSRSTRACAGAPGTRWQMSVGNALRNAV